jgi:hypothetical protein
MAAAVCSYLLGAAHCGVALKHRDLILWTAVLASPAAWFANLETNYALASLSCLWQWRVVILSVSAATFAIALASGIVSWGQWRQSTGEGPTDTRARGMAAGGAVLGVMFALTIFAQAIPNFMLAGCQ